MKITKEHIQEILADYHILNQIEDITYFIEYYPNEKNQNTKVISKVILYNHVPLVIKLINEDRHCSKEIEEQSVFSEILRITGILTPKRYKSNGTYCIEHSIENIMLSITVEDYIGEEIKAITLDDARQIGELFGRMHCISEANDCHIHYSGLFNLMDWNEASGYDKFIELGEADKLDSTLFHAIKNKYLEHLNSVKSIWSQLPKYATQGDISINNLTFTKDQLGVFDYNNGCDEVLVSDMIIEGLLTAYDMDVIGDIDRKELFYQFVSGYRTQRILSDLEIEAMHHIYSISDALWATKIMAYEHSLTKLVERDETEKITALLEEMFHIISTDYWDEL